MILPIYAYGTSVLRRKGKKIDKDYPYLQELLLNMWETIDNVKSIGLAAPQIGQSIRVFMVDTLSMEISNQDFQGIRKTFINAQMITEEGEVTSLDEACLSIPGIRANVNRQETIKIKYLNENFEEEIETYTGINARVIQHEYDHIEGILFISRLEPLKRKMLAGKLNKIAKGKVEASFEMVFAKQ